MNNQALYEKAPWLEEDYGKVTYNDVSLKYDGAYIRLLINGAQTDIDAHIEDIADALDVFLETGIAYAPMAYASAHDPYQQAEERSEYTLPADEQFSDFTEREIIDALLGI